MKHHKTLRRGFSVLLSLMLCLTMLPTIALAEEGGGLSVEILINEDNFPDDNFRQYVSNYIDKNSSGSLSNEEIAAVTTINCSNKGIKSLLGIGYFTALQTLDCSQNQLTALNISKNTNLKILNCYKNQLTALDISKNTSLEELWCYSNQLTELNVEKNKALTKLWCYGNQLTELNVKNNTNLTQLACYDNQLTELNVEKNKELTYLHCANCGLTELNVKNNTKLTLLYCYTNRLTELDITQNTELTKLNCNSNYLTTLDLSKNTKLTDLSCQSNRLTSLDFSNIVSEKPNLTPYNNCYDIVPTGGTFDLTELKQFGFKPENVIDGTWTNGTVSGTTLTVNPGATKVTYNYDCGKGKSITFTLLVNDSSTGVPIDSAHFPDEAFRTYLSGIGTDRNQDGHLSAGEISRIWTIDVSNTSSLTDLTGIEYFTSLSTLKCSSCALSSLDLSSNTALQYLNCNDNQLKTLDVSSNTKLTNLLCARNQLTSLDLSNNNDIIDYYFYAADNDYPITLTNRTFDLTELTSYGFKLDNVIDETWTNGTVEGTTLTVNPGATEVTYNYNCGNGKTVTFKLLVANKYTISFNANGGSVTPASAETDTNGKLSTLPTPTRNGYTFEGWFTETGTAVTTDTVFDQDTTLYADWSINYGVTVNGVKVTSLNKDNVLGNDNVKYNPATKTLSVKDFMAGGLIVTGDGETIVNISDNLGAPAVGALTVTGAKDVTVTANSGAPAILNKADITCTGNVTITNSKGMAVSAPLTVTNAQNVTVEGCGNQAIAGITDITCTGNVTITNSKGMAVSNPLTVNSAKDVTVTANTSTAPAIAGTADITCTGKVEITNSTGMAVNSGLTVKNANDVIVTANTASTAIGGTTDITCTGKVEITNSTGMAVSDGLTVKSAKDVIVTANTENTGNTDYPAVGGTVDITCSGKVDITNKAGMAVSGALTVKSAKDVTVTANTASPAIAGTADITCSGDVIISNSNSDGRAVVNGLIYQRAGDHGYTVKTGPSLDELTDYAVKEAGQVFTATLDAPAVKISVGHTADEWQNSSTQHWQVCTVCEEEFNRADHTFSGRTCTVCGYTKPSTGGSSSPDYSVTVDDIVNGTVTVSPKSVKQGDTVTITVTTNEGYTLETLTALDKNGKEIKLTNSGSGKYTFTMPASNVTVEATFMEDNSMLNFFVDVSADAYYYNAVLWAVENGITGGVDDTHFAPDASCTRAQMVTFLWRAAGSPKADGSSPFTDVSPDAYYYDAVLWAVENGITSGTSATTFAPDAAVTRDQTVTFMWRAAGSPAANGSGFSDVSGDAYYADAVAWAVENGITTGTGSGLFSPDDDCTRAQIVTFLYRYMGEE